MELTDICAREVWEALEVKVFEKFHFQASVFDPEGKRITGTRWFANTLCPAIKAEPNGQAYICSAAHANMTAMVKTSRQPMISECDAGMTKIVVPIFYNQEFLGVAGGCGLLSADNEIDTYAVFRLSGMDEEMVKALSRSVRPVTGDTITAMIRLIQNQLSCILGSHCQTEPSP
jgi:ligand-binding sensor protein